MLDAGFPSALATLQATLGIPPEAAVPVMYIESALEPSTHRSGTNFYGLNQISASWLSKHGVDPSVYLGWSASAQLANMVTGYWRWAKSFGRLDDAGRLMWAQLAPATLGNAIDASSVVFTSPSQEYQGNQWLDLAHDGTITLGDLQQVMAGALKHAIVAQTIAAAHAASLSTPSASSPARSFAIGGAIALGGAAIGRWVLRRRRGARR